MQLVTAAQAPHWPRQQQQWQQQNSKHIRGVFLHTRPAPSVNTRAMGKASTSLSKRLHVFVSGRVQGVFFRAYTKNKALELGLTGWVRNRRDGRVEVTAEGYPEDLEAFLKWLHTGSPEADVSGIESSWSAATGEFEKFDKLWTE